MKRLEQNFEDSKQIFSREKKMKLPFPKTEVQDRTTPTEFIEHHFKTPKRRNVFLFKKRKLLIRQHSLSLMTVNK